MLESKPTILPLLLLTILMFLLTMQCIDYISIRFSVLRNKGCIQRKRLFLICCLPTLWVTHLLSNIICLIPALWVADLSWIYNPGKCKSIGYNNRIQWASRCTSWRGCRNSVSIWLKRWQIHQHSSPSYTQKVYLTHKRDRKQHVPVVPPPGWESAEMMPGYLKHRKSSPYR